MSRHDFVSRLIGAPYSVSTAAHSKKKNLEIEVLRSIAVVFMLLRHIHTLNPAPEGWIRFPGRLVGFWIGEDLFFVVPGFVIMGTLVGVPLRR